MLACFVALALQPSSVSPQGFNVTAEVAASLVKGEMGGWEVQLKGPATPANWTADPDSLQLSVAPVGDEPGGRQPTLSFVDPHVAVQGAAVNGKAQSAAKIAVSLSTGSSSPCFVRLRSSGFVIGTDPITLKTITLPVRANEALVYVSGTYQIPKLEPGLRFFYLPIKQLDLRQEDGSIIPFEKGELRELRLESIEQRSDNTFQAKFRMEGWPSSLTLEGTGDPLQIPGLPPVIWDETIKKLRTKYLAKPVWVYGGQLGAVSSFPDEWAAVRIGILEPIRIRKILRLYARDVMLNVGPQIAALGGETRSTFYADCPIYVLADIGTRGQVTAAMGSSADDMSKMLTRKVHLTGFQALADEWQFERTFSLASGISQHSDWSLDMVQSIADGKVKKGMTHAMVAWTLGWPCEPSSKRTLMKWSSWRYDIVNPYSYWVEFENGKVVRFGEDGGKPTRKR